MFSASLIFTMPTLPFEQQPLGRGGPLQQTTDASSSRFGSGVKGELVEKFLADRLGNL